MALHLCIDNMEGQNALNVVAPEGWTFEQAERAILEVDKDELGDYEEFFERLEILGFTRFELTTVNLKVN
jgi:hypothetical protein